MKLKGEELKLTARRILRDRGYENECLAVDDVADEISGTINNVSRKVKIYKWPGMILLILVPVISTSLSIAVTKSYLPALIVAWLSYALTLLTLFNSIFAPRERFTTLCNMGIPLHEVAIAFLADLEMLPMPVQEHDLHVVAERFDRILLPYKKGLINLFLPQAALDGGAKPKSTLEFSKPTGRRSTKDAESSRAGKAA